MKEKISDIRHDLKRIASSINKLVKSLDVLYEDVNNYVSKGKTGRQAIKR